MRLLLDTHVAVWWVYTPGKIAAPALDVLHHPDAELYVSAASLWEAAIKMPDGRMPPVDEQFADRLATARVETIPVGGECAWSVRRSSRLRHKDPFDRLIWEQARLENMPLITRDRELWVDPVRVVPA